MNLKEFFLQHPRAALGFSGGVDSAFLLAMAVKYGADVQPYFIKTVFQPAFELEDARRLTKELGKELIVVEYDILRDKEISSNPANRCYYCKKTLFSVLKENADKSYSFIVIPSLSPYNRNINPKKGPLPWNYRSY